MILVRRISDSEESRTVGTGLEEPAQAIAIPHLSDDRDSLTHPIDLIRLILDLCHTSVKARLSSH